MNRKTQLELARLLSDKIRINTWHPYGGTVEEISFKWRFDNPLAGDTITEKEWMTVCNLIEKMFSPNEMVEYVEELEQTIRRIENKIDGAKPSKKFPLNHFGRFAVITATTEQRAAAIFKIKKIQNMKAFKVGEKEMWYGETLADVLAAIEEHDGRKLQDLNEEYPLHELTDAELDASNQIDIALDGEPPHLATIREAMQEQIEIQGGKAGIICEEDSL